jgi:hypothetical protein
MIKFIALAIATLVFGAGCAKGKHTDPTRQDLETINKKLNEASGSDSSAAPSEPQQKEPTKDNLAKRQCTEDDGNNLKTIKTQFESEALRLNALADQLVSATAVHDIDSVRAPLTESQNIVDKMLVTCETDVNGIDANNCNIAETKSNLDELLDNCAQLKIVKTKYDTVQTLSN